MNWIPVFAYLGYLFGENMFLLKRANLVVQSETNPTSSTWAFIWRNKITILVRWFVAFFLFWIFLHFGFAQTFKMFGWTLPFQINAGVIPFMALGYCSDSLLDWIAAKPWVPAFFKDILPPSTFQTVLIPKANVAEAQDKLGAIPVKSSAVVESKS